MKFIMIFYDNTVTNELFYKLLNTDWGENPSKIIKSEITMAKTSKLYDLFTGSLAVLFRFINK